MNATFSLEDLERMARTAGPNAPIHAIVADLRRKAGKSPATGSRKPTTPPPPSQRRTLKITVPMPPNMGNASGQSRNPFAVERRKKRYWELLDQLAAAKLIPPPPSPCFGAVNVTSIMYVGGRMDRDNSVFRHKWVFDWLQDNEYLHNDRLVDWTDFPRQRVSRPRRGGLATISQDVARFGVHRIELELREP